MRKIEHCLYDTVIVYESHSTSNTDRVVHRLGEGDQLQVRVEPRSTHTLISITKDRPGPDEERYNDIVLQTPTITISETEIEIRGFVKSAHTSQTYVPRLVILTRSNTGWIEET